MGFVFLHEVQGVKNSIFHSIGNDQFAKVTLEEFYDQNRLSHEKLTKSSGTLMLPWK